MAGRRQAALTFDEAGAARLSGFHLGGKGYGLAQMAALGLPVPPGFTILTGVSRAKYQEGSLPGRLSWHVTRGLAELEKQTGRVFGDPERPLLVSVRSGAPVSMPGMMDTVLNVGINQVVVDGLARQGGMRFAFDCYRRFLSLFGQVVLGIEREWFSDIMESAKCDAGVKTEQELTGDTLVKICVRMCNLIEELTGAPVPDDPRVQLNLAIGAVIRSWWSERAMAYRKTGGIKDSLGTAVNVQSMVFGNQNHHSATGVVFSADTSTGQAGFNGEFLVTGQGEDVVAGIAAPLDIEEMRSWNPRVYDELESWVSVLEEHYGDIVDVEFTVESGQLYILQARVAKRTSLAAVVHAVHQVWAGRWQRKEVIEKYEWMARGLPRRPEFSSLMPDGIRVLAEGIGASPGGAVGRVATTCQEAIRLASQGEQVILYRFDTVPDDLPGMLAAKGIFTAKGGPTSHAAVVARERGIPAAVGCYLSKEPESGGIVSVNGTTGRVFVGALPFAEAPEVPREVGVLLRWCDQPEPIRVRLDLTETRVSVNELMNSFFLADAMLHQTVGTEHERAYRSLRLKIATRVSEILLVYLLVAIGGELRHSNEARSVRPRSAEDRAAVYAITVLRGRFGVWPDRDPRGEAQDSVIQCLLDQPLTAIREFLELAVTVFSNELLQRGDNYGGAKWAAIAHAALDFVSGRLSMGIFVDRVADLRHNRNRLFDKHAMVKARTNDERIVRQLSIKRQAVDIAMLRASLSEYGRFDDDVAAAWIIGVGDGLWPDNPETDFRRRERKWCNTCQSSPCKQI